MLFGNIGSEGAVQAIDSFVPDIPLTRNCGQGPVLRIEYSIHVEDARHRMYLVSGLGSVLAAGRVDGVPVDVVERDAVAHRAGLHLGGGRGAVRVRGQHQHGQARLRRHRGQRRQ